MERPIQVPLAGVDGCRAGWLMARWDHKGFSYNVYPHLRDLLAENRDLKRVLLDMPIGLTSDGAERTLDTALRKELKGRSSTVFTPPCREALYLDDPAAARERNQQVTGKSISQQTLNIREKMLEVDTFLGPNPEFRETFFESHPELCFKYLNGGKVLKSSKSTKEGHEERVKLLKKYSPDAVKLLKKIIKETKRKEVKRDDAADAVCLCVVNWLARENGLDLIQHGLEKDAGGIPIRLGYHKPQKAS